MIPSRDLVTMARRDGAITMANTIPIKSTGLRRPNLRDNGGWSSKRKDYIEIMGGVGRYIWYLMDWCDEYFRGEEDRLVIPGLRECNVQ